jgi:hypothetical protein
MTETRTVESSSLFTTALPAQAYSVLSLLSKEKLEGSLSLPDRVHKTKVPLAVSSSTDSKNGRWATPSSRLCSKVSFRPNSPYVCCIYVCVLYYNFVVNKTLLRLSYFPFLPSFPLVPALRTKFDSCSSRILFVY